MNRKNIVAGGLLVTSAAVWLPQVFGAGSQERVLISEEFPADVDWNDGGPEAGAVFAATSARSQAPAAVTQEEQQSNLQNDSPEDARLEQSGDLLDELEGSLDAVDSIAARDREPDLGELIRSLNAAREQVDESFDDGTNEDLLAAGEAYGIPIENVLQDEIRAEFESFAFENPLTAVIHGPDDAAALLGRRILRVGDRVHGGKIEVLSIEPASIRLGWAEQELTIQLPPFTAHSPSESSFDRDGSGASSAPSHGAGNPAGSSTGGGRVDPQADQPANQPGSAGPEGGAQ